MISKVQPINIYQSFENNLNSNNTELIKYQKDFLKEQYQKKYQNDLKDFKRDNILDLLIGLGVAGYLLFTGNKKIAGVWTGICLLFYPLTFLFKPKVSKYNNKLQEELNKLDNKGLIKNSQGIDIK